MRSFYTIGRWAAGRTGPQSLAWTSVNVEMVMMLFLSLSLSPTLWIAVLTVNRRQTTRIPSLAFLWFSSR